MKPLIVLLLVFGGVLAGTRLLQGVYNGAWAGQVALAAMLLFAAIGHFAYPKGMSLMLPPFVPFKMFLVYLTGIMEIAFAIGLLLPVYRIWTGWLLIAFLIVVLPANIYAAVKRIDLQKPGNEGPGLAYLWFRIPLQLLFIAWTYYFAIYLPVH